MVYLCLQEEEEGIGDVDLFTLTEDRRKLVVNVKWLQHLQVCLIFPIPCPLSFGSLHMTTWSADSKELGILGELILPLSRRVHVLLLLQPSAHGFQKLRAYRGKVGREHL